MSKTKSILKWPGGKFRILDFLFEYFPKDKKRLVEPFVGGGAVFMNFGAEKYFLCDLNKDLIDFYKILQKDKFKFIKKCQELFAPETNNKEYYLKAREEFNKTRKPELFLYLNRHCFRGLVRYNLKNEFNVPFGGYRSPYFPEKEMVYFIENKADKCEFRHQGFEKTFKEANESDLFFCDPPYLAISKTSNFTSYTSGGFDLEQHKKLAILSFESNSTSIISNHDIKLAREIYQNADEIKKIDVRRNISCQKREIVRELIAVFESAKVEKQ